MSIHLYERNKGLSHLVNTPSFDYCNARPPVYTYAFAIHFNAASHVVTTAQQTPDIMRASLAAVVDVVVVVLGSVLGH